jgi:acetylornithine deacetylase
MAPLPSVSVDNAGQFQYHAHIDIFNSERHCPSMLTDTERSLLNRVDMLRDKLASQTADLVRIPTVNPYCGDSSAGIEAAGQDWIEERFRELGAETQRIPVPSDIYDWANIIGPKDRCWDGRENVVAEWKLGNGDGPRIILNDHMDTVGVEGMDFDPFDPVVEDGVMRGRGTSDTKGNMIMGLIAVETLLRESTNLNGSIVFESVVDEECNGGGAGTLACCRAGITGDFAICLDGAGDILHYGCNGVVTAAVHVIGKAGHAALPDAVNAIDKAIAVKIAIDALAEEHKKEWPGCLINVGMFHSGVSPAVVPGEAELQLNVSYAHLQADAAHVQGLGYSGILFRKQFEELMSRMADSDPWFAQHPPEVTWIKDIPPFYSDPTHPYILLASHAAAAVSPAPVPLGILTAWTDACYLSTHLRIPALGMGAGSPGMAHTNHESVRLDDLVTGAKAVALTLHRMLVGE